MHWTETLLWIALALFLEKLLDYAVWPRWVKRRWRKKGLRLTIIKPKTRYNGRAKVVPDEPNRSV